MELFIIKDAILSMEEVFSFSSLESIISLLPFFFLEIHDYSWTGNKVMHLAADLLMRIPQYHFWGRFAKFNTPKGKAVDPNKGRYPSVMSGSPIVIQRELRKKGGDKLEIPMFRELINLPKTGLAQLKGQEEKQKVNHAEVYLEILRHAVKPQDGAMSIQRAKQMKLIERSYPMLRQHYANVENSLQCSTAFYNGYSWNLLNGERALSAVSHPHVYTSGGGKVSYSSAYPGNSGYETAIGTALGLIGSTDVFDTEFLDGLAADDQIKRIPYLHTKDGTAYKIIVCHGYQLYDLRQDSKFRDTVANALASTMAKDNPLLTGCKYFWGDWAIFDGGNAVFPVSVSAGVPVWGPTTITNLTSYQDFSSYSMFGAIILGSNAMFKAIGSGMRFISETEDYEEILGIAYRLLEGWSRGDFRNLDDGTTGQYIINDGSAVAVTFGSKPNM